MRLQSKADFEALRADCSSRVKPDDVRVLVCCGTGCLANGARAVADAFTQALSDQRVSGSVQPLVKTTGCHGFCEKGPLVLLEPSGILYTRVTPADVPAIVEKTLVHGETIPKLLYRDPATGSRIERQSDIPFYAQQTRIAMRNIGRIDPRSIEDAIAHGAYEGLVRAVFDSSPADVIAQVERSGLRGRGGAGFPTARKWKACHEAKADRKFVICNGDEGDPGAFKDRSIMEGDPHAVIEGMLIGAWAVGASEGHIYVRDEYPLAIEHLAIALRQARELGLLGDRILGTGFDFDIRISRGAGAFVCGESSALMRSIEGRTGEPRVKYIHATQKGLFDCPTVLNNVETWSHVGAILRRGADWFRSIGTASSRGTKAFSLVGKVRNTGLVELPMGTTLRHIISDIGGGTPAPRQLKAVQTGGPSGGCLPESLFDLPVDYEALTRAGSMMGSGGMIVMDDRTCMVDVARYFVEFLVGESCGKCTPCREGLTQMLVILKRIQAGGGRSGDIALLERIASVMHGASLCELGKSAVNPVLSTLKYFRGEYEAHIQGKKCPAGTCREITSYAIRAEDCSGCHLCSKACPSDAVTGQPRETHVIDQTRCISCGACFEVCKPGAVAFFPRLEREVAVHAHVEH